MCPEKSRYKTSPKQKCNNNFPKIIKQKVNLLRTPLLTHYFKNDILKISIRTKR